ncbi:hypothetical protein O181_068317 [Austropuccinia psidii MF-1]|uniref:Uncharacterized protein n=1 Tax=Austropuccinia psidii MF-1 TaxID=1389203 RepID=A0A9Q3F294_9BASI|nr:hypothetical protein [Austropuccinia psidii MF-1]
MIFPKTHSLIPIKRLFNSSIIATMTDSFLNPTYNSIPDHDLLNLNYYICFVLSLFDSFHQFVSVNQVPYKLFFTMDFERETSPKYEEDEGYEAFEDNDSNNPPQKNTMTKLRRISSNVYDYFEKISVGGEWMESKWNF